MEKIKAVLTGGHSSHDAEHTTDAKTPDVDAPGAYPSDNKPTEGHTKLSKLGGHQHRDTEIGAAHTQGRHDPEVDAKEATSSAGNYPYWGDLPKEGEQGYTPGAAVGGTHGDASHNLQKDAGLAGGAGLATGATAASGVTTGNRPSEYEQRALGTQDTSSATHSALPDRAREAVQTSEAQGPSATYPVQDDRRGEIAAATGVGAAGAAGATYLGTRHHDEQDQSNVARAPGAASGTTSAGPGTLDPGYASQTDSSATAPQTFTNISDSSYAPSEGTGHRKEEEALAAGAGAAGLGGAGLLAHNRAEDNSRADDGLTTSHGLQQREASTGLASSPSQDTSAATGGIHNTVVGAGSDEDKFASQRTRKAPFDATGLTSSHGTTGTPQTGAVDPREQSSISGALGSAPRSGDDREKQGLAGAAGLGAGAGAVAAEEKHRHHAQPAQTATASQPAQLAAQSAWNKQNQGNTPATTTSSSALRDPEDEARQATSAAGNYPHLGSNDGTAATGQADRSSHTGAAVGSAAGLAGAGATAAYYGQGKEHDQNPRSSESQTIAGRALGSDGAAHAPSSGGVGGQERSFPLTDSNAGLASTGSSGGAAAAGLSSGAGQDSSRVVHKCQQCGADNDISHYFKKDAAFRMGS